MTNPQGCRQSSIHSFTNFKCHISIGLFFLGRYFPELARVGVLVVSVLVFTKLRVFFSFGKHDIQFIVHTKSESII
jgi:hypothetical protein